MGRPSGGMDVSRGMRHLLRPTWEHLLLAALVIVVTWGIFAQVLSGAQYLLVRDAAHFYPAVFRFNRDEWTAGRVPLWDPYSNLGQPHLANATASVLYPGQVVFLLPAASFAQSYAAYVVGHLWLACASCFCLARKWTCARSAMAAALSYGFGGCVLGLHANIVYLVGAAWLPWIVLAGVGLLHVRSWRRVPVLAALLAMPIMGGDPQLSLHAMLILAGYSVSLQFWRTSAPLAKSPAPGLRLQSVAGSLLQLFAAGALCLLLTAAQVLPSLQAVSNSERVAARPASNTLHSSAHQATQTAAALPLQALATQSEGLQQEVERVVLEADTRSQQLKLDFSVGPWRWPEILLPNFSGRSYPTHTRWMNANPAERRAWVPTLYAGFLPGLAALAALRVRGASRQRKLACGMVVFGLLLACGEYGASFFAQQTGQALGLSADGLAASSAASTSNAWGGPYWLLARALPGYSAFRYPGKWLVVFALGWSLLAALGWRHLERRLSRWTGAKHVSLALLAALAVCVIARQPLLAVLSQVPAHALFGPMQVQPAYQGLLVSLVQPLAALYAGFFVCSVARRQKKGRYVQSLLLVVVATDLFLANRWVAAKGAPSELAEWFHATTAADQAKLQPEEGTAFRRIYRENKLTRPRWANSSSRRRYEDIVSWEFAHLYGMYPLGTRQPALPVLGSMEDRSWRYFWRVCNHLNHHPRPEIALATHDRLRALSAVPLNSKLLAAQLAGPALPEKHGPAAFASTMTPWIVHHVDIVPPAPENDARTLIRTFFVERHADWHPRSLAATALVETSEENMPAWRPAPPITLKTENADEHCTVLEESPQQIRIRARLASPGLIVVPSMYDTNWRAVVTKAMPQPQPTGAQLPGTAPVPANSPGQQIPIYRTNRVMRGLSLPAGEFELALSYHSGAFITGAWASALAWIALVLLGVLRIRKGTRQTP